MTRKARKAQPKGPPDSVGKVKRAGPENPPEPKKLTPLQERFCQEYIIDLNATQAAQRAGYQAKRLDQAAYELLRKPEIERRVAELQGARGERTQITQDYVLSNLQEVLERCMQRAPVLVREGREYVQATDEQGRDVWEFNSKGALGALKLLGDHLGMYSTNVKLSTPKGESLNVSAVSRVLRPEEMEGMSAQDLARLYFETQ